MMYHPPMGSGLLTTAAAASLAMLNTGVSIDGVPLVGLTAPTLLGAAILMLLTGKLWTNAAYQQKCAESDKWQAAYEKERETRLASDAQTSELLEVTKTTNAVITAMFVNTGKYQAPGGPSAVPME